MSSLSGTLYIGMTGNLHKRVFEHKFHRIEGFTDEYDVERLLYWESYDEFTLPSGARNSSKAGAAKRRSC